MTAASEKPNIRISTWIYSRAQLCQTPVACPPPEDRGRNLTFLHHPPRRRRPKTRRAAVEMAYYNQSSSPPPLQHPVPTHPAYIPEPPSTPASPQGYQRYASSPQPQAYGQPQTIPAGATMSRAPVPPAGSYSAYGHMAPQPHQAHIPAPAAPDFSAWGLNDATAQFGMQLGQNAVAAGQDYVQKNVRPHVLLICHLIIEIIGVT